MVFGIVKFSSACTAEPVLGSVHLRDGYQLEQSYICKHMMAGPDQEHLLQKPVFAVEQKELLEL